MFDELPTAETASLVENIWTFLTIPELGNDYIAGQHRSKPHKQLLTSSHFAARQQLVYENVGIDVILQTNAV